MSAKRSADRTYCPDQGDIVWLQFNPQRGREQAGHRRALVLTPRSYNRITRLCIVCPITFRVKGYPLESAVPPGGDTIGAVLCDHVRSVAWEHQGATFVEKAPPGLLLDTRAKLKALLSIP